MFIFNLNVVFTTDFLKMAPMRVRFSRDFLQEQDFTESNLCQGGSKQLHKKCAMLGQLTKPTVHRTYFLPVKLSSLRGTRSPPEHSSL
jgi:hypothetical protein